MTRIVAQYLTNAADNDCRCCFDFGFPLSADEIFCFVSLLNFLFVRFIVFVFKFLFNVSNILLDFLIIIGKSDKIIKFSKFSEKYTGKFRKRHGKRLQSKPRSLYRGREWENTVEALPLICLYTVLCVCLDYLKRY